MQSSSYHPQPLLSRLLSAFALSPSMAEKTNCLIVLASLFLAQLAIVSLVFNLMQKSS
jgi:F0F1-type ATP synthase membrane subunit c/vacuolar-type H+-ATPase subunit K